MEDDLSGSSAASEEETPDEEVDLWNTVFSTKRGDTMRTVAAQLGIPVVELQNKNYDLPGSCPRTGRTHPDAELLPGTGLWVKDPDDDGEANAVTRAPGPRTLADFITEDSGITVANDAGACEKRPGMNHGTMSPSDEDSAYQRCYNAVMEQEQKEIERTLLGQAERGARTAGEVRYDERQGELFGEFVRTKGVLEAPAQPPKQRARHSIGRGQRARNHRPGKSPMAIKSPATLKRPPNKSLQHAGNQKALLAIGGKGLDVTSTLVPPRTMSGGPRNILTDGARRGGRPTGTDPGNIPRAPGDAMPPDPMRQRKK